LVTTTVTPGRERGRDATASLLMMAGADLPAVQRIMRHTDPRITTKFYGHLAPGYLRGAIDRLALSHSTVSSLSEMESTAPDFVSGERS
jgi:hypothetical protein